MKTGTDNLQETEPVWNIRV